MPSLRPLLAATACCLVALLLVAPSVAADLTLRTHTGASYDIYASGASTLAAPRNTTLIPFRGGYLLDWRAPALADGQSVAGYTVYRVPGPSTAGDVEAIYVPARMTLAFDDPDAGTYVYFVTATFSGASAARESIPSNPVSTQDVGGTNYPHCSVVSVYTSPPYYEAHIGCLFPIV